MADRNATVSMLQRRGSEGEKTKEIDVTMVAKRRSGLELKDLLLAAAGAALLNGALSARRSTDQASATATSEHQPGPGSEVWDLKRLVDNIANALGACALCWGLNPGCSECRGKGKPDLSRADRSLFDRYLTPVARWAGDEPQPTTQQTT